MRFTCGVSGTGRSAAAGLRSASHRWWLEIDEVVGSDGRFTATVGAGDAVALYVGAPGSGTQVSSGASFAVNATTVVGRVNVNTAPQQVLMALPGFTEADAQALIAQRQTGGDMSSIAWVVQAMASQPQKALVIGDAITTRSYQYSADIVAVSGDGRTFKRVRIVVDGRTSPAKTTQEKSDSPETRK